MTTKPRGGGVKALVAGPLIYLVVTGFSGDWEDVKKTHLWGRSPYNYGFHFYYKCVKINIT